MMNKLLALSLLTISFSAQAEISNFANLCDPEEVITGPHHPAQHLTVKEWTKRAEAGDHKAQQWVAHCYEYGCIFRKENPEYNFSRNGEKSLYWFRQSAEKNVCSQEVLAYLYDKGHSKNFTIKTQVNKNESLKWFKRLNEEGFPKYPLAKAYLTGLGIQKNETKGVQLLEKIVQSKTNYLTDDYGNARYMLAVTYLNGVGGKKDYEKAYNLLKEMEEIYDRYKGYSPPYEIERLAYGELGVMYANGDYVPRNYKKAVYYYRTGSLLEDTTALKNLAYAYYNGELGLNKSLLKAYVLFNTKATIEHDEEQHKRTAAILSLLEEKMTSKDIKKAQSMTACDVLNPQKGELFFPTLCEQR